MKPRGAMVVVGVAVAAWLAMVVVRSRLAVRAVSDAPVLSPAAPPVGSRHVVHLPDVAGVLSRATAGVGAWASGWAPDGKALLVVAAAAVVLGWLVRLVAVGVRLRSTAQDPQRMYSSEQRREAFGRAGGRCEYTGLFGRRCRADAEHADHAFPWTLGGATSLDNCVASCARHNLSKGAKVLTRHQVRALERRRRGYFPSGADVSVERRYVSAPVPTRFPAAGSLRVGRRTARSTAPQPPHVPSPWVPDAEAAATRVRDDEVEQAPAGW